MKKILFNFVSTSIIVFLFSSCNPMKKNVMNDNCDDVEETVISESNGRFALITREEIFQATSKSNDRGIRKITGWTEYRLTSYDINTGEVIKRIGLGDMRDNECVLLGFTEGKLWYKSVNPELGFHARDPVTLDVTVSEKMITEANPFLQNNLSRPEWNSIRKFYGFDISKNMPMISDNAGYLYFIDPVSLKAEKTASSLEHIKFDESVLTSSLNFDGNNTVYLSGDPRKRFDIKNKIIDEPSFLNGEIIKSSCDAFMPNEYLSGGVYKDAAEKKDPIRLKRKNDPENNFAKGEIITKDGCIFVLSRTDATDQAKVIISKVKINGTESASLQWETVLDNIYRDPDKALDKSAFDDVFSKGDPELSTMRTAYSDNKLVFIFMLKATCIDEHSGKVLWSKDL
ncbi:MAG TPA: hypothetical protein DCY06_12195 [Bacteroidetes bacterium]|nr:hypothetical protein [Bacteroidota bacterium]